jgi:hypothetical protein
MAAKTKTKMMVTQPYHGEGGVLLFEPGHIFEAGEELPDNIAVAEAPEEQPEPGWHPMEYPADDPGLVIPVSDHGSGDYWPTGKPAKAKAAAKDEDGDSNPDEGDDSGADTGKQEDGGAAKGTQDKGTSQASTSGSHPATGRASTSGGSRTGSR